MSVCAICHEDLDKSEHVKLKCNHEYHQKCIFRWVSYKNECPYCKAPQFEGDFDILESPEIARIINQRIDKAVKSSVRWNNFFTWVSTIMQLLMIFNSLRIMLYGKDGWLYSGVPEETYNHVNGTDLGFCPING